MFKRLFLLLTHALALVLGISIGIYVLPILTAPPAPDPLVLRQHEAGARYHAELRRDLPGSDLLHWGEGRVSLSHGTISLIGQLAPGPDYRLYLTPEYVTDKAAFLAIKERALPVGAVRSFDGFLLPMAAAVDLDAYRGIVIWCETFEKFITAGRYR